MLHNQILKTTIADLLKVKDLDLDLRYELWEAAKWLQEVKRVRLTSQTFRRIQLHRNNNYYRFLLNVCELVFENLLVDESSGYSRFRDFLRDERQMRILFEQFVRNFYRLRQSEFKVDAQKLKWNLVAADEHSGGFVPEMRTDICLVSSDRQIIIECKFAQRVFTSHFDKESITPAHLYQIYAYLQHAELQKGWHDLEGILLYPVVKSSVDLNFKLDDHPFRIKTIDLNQKWQDIEFDLLEIIN